LPGFNGPCKILIDQFEAGEFSMKRLFAGALAAGIMTFAMSASAGAATLLTLTGPISGHTVGPQSTSDPCIICATTASNPAGFGYNNFIDTGAISSYDMWSTTPTATVLDGVKGTPYTVGQILTVTNNSPFVVAIDVNTAGGAGGGLETLQLFEVWDTTTNTVLYNYTGPTLIGNISNNGNGYGDWYLGNIDLSGLSSTDGILFHAKWNNATDGGESFFLVPASAVPEPATWAMMILGFGMVGFAMRRRRSSELVEA
jgi:hypothetical protein